jgi:uracil DNA glycosylase
MRANMLQDPYPAPGQAHGLCFSVPAGQEIPFSLRVIYEEVGQYMHSLDSCTVLNISLFETFRASGCPRRAI